VSRLSILATAVALLVACGQNTPAPPDSGSSGGAGTVTAANRLAWDQTADDAAELSRIRYALYVDGTRSELAGVSCATTSTGGSFACTAPVPSMAPGRHLLELASFIVDGEVLESPRSPGIQVTFVGGLTAPANRAPDQSLRASAATSNGRNRANKVPIVVEGLDQVSDMAFAPDGRLFVAERTGRIRIVRDGRLLAQPALEVPHQALRSTTPGGSDERSERGTPDTTGMAMDAGAILALTFDPQFDRNHFVYTLHTARSRQGRLSFMVARYREAGDTLADRAVLLDDIPASPADPAGALRFGLDGMLYVAFDDGGDPRFPGDLASPNGKVLRLNADGTTPDDQAGASPLYSSEYRSPRGLGWDSESSLLWVIDRVASGSAELSAVGTAAINGRKRGTTKASRSLPQPLEPSAMVFLEDSVLIASGHGEPLMRARIDPQDRTRINGMEALLPNMTDGIQALTVGADGAVYFATAGTIHRLSLP
jgi:aldose sugar dehydrogenase